MPLERVSYAGGKVTSYEDGSPRKIVGIVVPFTILMDLTILGSNISLTHLAIQKIQERRMYTPSPLETEINAFVFKEGKKLGPRLYVCTAQYLTVEK